MNEAEKEQLTGELKDFYKKLRSYQNRQSKRTKEDTSEAKELTIPITNWGDWEGPWEFHVPLE